jgi:hypothetical protein
MQPKEVRKALDSTSPDSKLFLYFARQVAADFHPSTHQLLRNTTTAIHGHEKSTEAYLKMLDCMAEWSQHSGDSVAPSQARGCHYHVHPNSLARKQCQDRQEIHDQEGEGWWNIVKCAADGMKKKSGSAPTEIVVDFAKLRATDGLSNSNKTGDPSPRPSYRLFSGSGTV